MDKIKLRITELYVLIKLFIAWLVTGCHSRKNVWLISERGCEARDNGFVFFEYLKKNHTHLNVKYVIDPNSKDFYKFNKYPNSTVRFGSFEHCKSLCKSSTLVSTHIMGYTPFMDFFVKLDRNFKIFRHRKQIFLQHGIIKDYLPGLMKGAINVDLFCCGAKPEYDYILANFGHSKQIVKYTGLCRYDNLNNFKSKRQILVMPTWRMYERGKDFITTKYYHYWSCFLKSDQLYNYLEKFGYELVFYPHYEIQKYITSFLSLDLNPCVKIADFNFDVQTLLKESCMLITDYSSVYFDIAYMRKPIIFYQFDEEEFRRKHYQRGYLREENLGYKCITQEKLFEVLYELLENGMTQDYKYIEYADKFFEMRDDKNCQRVYEAIVNS